MEGLTAVFGMRTGVPPPLKHQLQNFNILFSNFIFTRTGGSYFHKRRSKWKFIYIYLQSAVKENLFTEPVQVERYFYTSKNICQPLAK